MISIITVPAQVRPFGARRFVSPLACKRTRRRLPQHAGLDALLKRTGTTVILTLALATGVFAADSNTVSAVQSPGDTSQASTPSTPSPQPKQNHEPEKWLPEDTIGFIALRDVKAAAALLQRTPRGKLWQDPAMKPFRDKTIENWKRDFLQPLERELNIELKDLESLFSGPATLALVRNERLASGDQPGFGWLLVADTGEKAALLSEKLTGLRNGRAGGGKQIRTVTIREHEFLAVNFDTNGPLGKPGRFLPRALEFQELGRRAATNRPASNELLIGQSGSFLMLSTSDKSLEKVLLRMGGAAAPVLQNHSGYDICHKRLFASAPVYGWINARAWLAIYAPQMVRETSAPPPPTLVDVLDKAQVVKASGLGALQAAGFALIESPEGLRMETFLNVPEPGREGLLRILAGQPKPCDVPAFVPGDVAEFQRWRVGGAEAWAILEKMMSEISPRWINAINLIIDTANQYANLTDPGFDVRKNLVANLGDDIITYSKAPRAGVPNPSLLMVSSPNPVQLAAAVQRILIFMTAEAESPPKREFLGRTIYSVPLPYVPMPLGETGPATAGRWLHYTATSSYVVLSTDATLVEEHLRSAEATSASLKDLPNLRQAAEMVIGPGTSMFAYKDNLLLEKTRFEEMRSFKTGGTNLFPQLTTLSWAGLVAPEQGLQQWMDFSLLPPFERVAKYFHYTVRGTSATREGLTISWFDPVPPPLRQQAGN
jgi:hypothetical protein